MVSSRLILLLLPFILGADEGFEAFKKAQQHDFKDEKVKFIDFKKAQDKAFETHLQKEKEAISAYRKKVNALWGTSDLEDPDKLVNYSKDLHTKTLIDFKKNEVIISRISPDKKVTGKELLKELSDTLQMNNIQAFKKSTLEQKIDKSAQESKYVKIDKLDKQRLIPIDPGKIKGKDIKLLKKEKLYQIKYTLPKDATYRRSSNYLVAAKSNAQRFRLRAQWLLAIMHSESSFNPMARSWVPAYGLMQIVPKTAGIDSYLFLYKKRRLLSASYLYNTKNNIEIGSAYFHILYYRYLSSIKDPTSRLYCAIAGYNTGAGNVARAFVGTNSVKKAAVLINKMSPESVYAHLLKHLRHDEPKHYLKRVRARSKKYQELYKL